MTLPAPNPPPLPAPPARRSRRLFVFGCAAGCLGVALAFVLGLTLLCLAALELPPFDPKLPRGVPPVPEAFVGSWQAVDEEGSTITIGPDGRGDCDIRGRGGNYRIAGGRARYDLARRSLSLKLWIFGPSWRVDVEPHPAAGGTEMTLNGRLYRRQGHGTHPDPSKTWTEWRPSCKPFSSDGRPSSRLDTPDRAS